MVDPFRDCHCFKALAGGKGSSANGDDSIGNGQCLKLHTSCERVCSNVGHQLAEGHLCQAPAFGKSVILNGGHLVGDIEFFETDTLTESSLADGREPGRQGQVAQPRAALKRVAANGGEPCRESQTGQCGAAVKGIIADAGDLVGEGNALQILAVMEYVAAYAGDPSGHAHTREACTGRKGK